MTDFFRFVTIALCLSWIAALPSVANPDGLTILNSPHSFKILEKRLPKAIKSAGMLRVFKASASRGAKARGIALAGDSVYGVFRNDFAVRTINANPLAGTEAPILIHIIENKDETASLIYKTPSTIFANYKDTAEKDLARLATELDEIFASIANAAISK